MSFGTVVLNFTSVDDEPMTHQAGLAGIFTSGVPTFSGGILKFNVVSDKDFSVVSYNIAKSTTGTSGYNLGTPTIVLNSATGKEASFCVYMVSSTGVLNGTFKQFSVVLCIQE